MSKTIHYFRYNGLVSLHDMCCVYTRLIVAFALARQTLCLTSTFPTSHRTNLHNTSSRNLHNNIQIVLYHAAHSGSAIIVIRLKEQ